MQESLQGSVVVRMPNWIGDAVMATPALRALRRAAPAATICALATRPVRRLLERNHTVDRWIDVERRGRHRGVRGWLRLVREIRSVAPTTMIVLPHSFSSGLLALASGAPRRVGFHTAERGWMLSVTPRAPQENGRRRPRPMTEHYLDLLGAIGVPADGEQLELTRHEEEDARAAQLLSDLGLAAGEPYCAVNPGASFGASKFWTVDAFAETIDRVEREFGWRTIVLCGPGEESLAAQIAAAATAAIDTSRSVVPLELLKPLLAGARLLVTTDTGPRHIATAMRVPTVVVMGPTDPRYTASNLELTRVLRVDVECGPCHRKVCPLDHRCMTQLTPSMALEAARDVLARGRALTESQHA